MAWNDKFDPEDCVFRIASSTENRIRVIAGPGTGKSLAIKRRVARLLEEGVEPSKILPVTFTRVAARDLHRELVGMKVKRCEEIQGTTLHSLALSILMRKRVLFATSRTPRPLNKFEMQPLVQDLTKYPRGKREVRKRIKAYEATWARLQRDNPGNPQNEADVEFEQDLQAWLRSHKAMLIGEVIPYLHEYLRSNPQAPERSEFSHILVDEFQDLNKAEQEVIKLMGENADVCIVGDDDQSIYSFKYAHPAGILEWCDANPGAADLGLSDCHRCPTQVVAMANRLIAKNNNRPGHRRLVAIPKKGDGSVRFQQYPTLADEVQAVAKWISELIKSGTLPGDILVLAQREVIGKPIYEALAEQKIPAKSYYAESELDKIEAQERFAYLTLLASPDDRVALRWLLGLNSKTWLSDSYQRLQRYCDTERAEPWHALILLANGEIQLPYTERLVKRFKSIQTEWEKLSNLMKKGDLTGLIDYLFPDGDTAFCEIRALSLETIKNMGAKDIVKFVEELNSAIAKPEISSEMDKVRIMSIHKSKGLSSPVTIIAGCVEGLLPKQPDKAESESDQQASIDEQRRLFFVGITRVKASPDSGKPGKLLLTCSLKMPLAQAMNAGITPASRHYEDARLDKSRFIGEMNPET